MAEEKLFEGRIKKYFHSVGIYPAGYPTDRMNAPMVGWYTKIWGGVFPLHCYIDSGVRHYLKYLRGDEDEPHDRAFLWNLLGALWTQDNKPELIDLPFGERNSDG